MIVYVKMMCKYVQVDIYQKLLLIKSNPIVFLLIPKDWLVCNFKSLVAEIFVGIYSSSSLVWKNIHIWSISDALRDLVPFVQFIKRKTHGGMSLLKFKTHFTKSNTPPWVFFAFLKLYKWYQIAQCITLEINRKW